MIHKFAHKSLSLFNGFIKRRGNKRRDGKEIVPECSGKNTVEMIQILKTSKPPGVCESVWVLSECVSEPRIKREVKTREKKWGNKKKSMEKRQERGWRKAKELLLRKWIEKEEFVNKVRKKNPASKRYLKRKVFKFYLVMVAGVCSVPYMSQPLTDLQQTYTCLLWGMYKTNCANRLCL